jgi:DNA-binding MarR family transcriptional regulator
VKSRRTRGSRLSSGNGEKIACCNEEVTWNILLEDDVPAFRHRERDLTSLIQEIAQQSPFSSLEEEAALNLLRSADFLERAIQRRTRAWGVTSTQYNVLRILRGAGPDGLTCNAIGERMITSEPDITRLLGRLKALKLIRQRRDPRDRRAVRTQITESGLELLRKMDPVMRKGPKDLLGHLTAPELEEMIRLLEKARQGDTQPLSCEGK